jgi:cytosine/adenosine deaminase-related metal-dependent hydrolase
VTAERRIASVPAMLNAHSHAFQRDLRGRAERHAPEAQGRDDFWTCPAQSRRAVGGHIT